MKRWTVAFLGLTMTMGITTGCQQKCFQTEKDYNSMIPAGLDDGYTQELVQPTNDHMAAPPNIDHPDRPARPLSLQEALAIALENGATGAKNGGVNTPGTVDDSSAVATGGTLNAQSDRMRVLALQPAISGANIEGALAHFDALSATSMSWQTTDEVPQGFTPTTNGQTAVFNTSIIKALPSGGVVNTSLQGQYTLLTSPPAGFLNPNYTARLTFGYEQPLLRNFGVEYNQLLARVAGVTGVTMPPAALNAFNNQQGNLGSVAGQPVEGILITRLRFDQQRAEFERQTHNLLLNVEVAYWNLYEAYGALYSNEEVLRVLHKLWMDTYYKAQSGDAKAPPDVLAQIRGQYEEFRGERTNALGSVLEAERNLRGILGLKAEDGTRLVPVTAPSLAAFQPNWDAALSDAMIHRPELVLARENLRFHQMVLTREKSYLQPDLRFVAQYQPVGTGTSLTGNNANTNTNALNMLSGDHFNDWLVGLNLSVPLGYRLEHASIRSARMQLAQAFYVLKDQEDRVQRTLTQQYQGVNKWYRLIEDRRAERRAYADSLSKKFKKVELGKNAIDLDLLDVQRRLALALTKEYQAIAEYNNALARLEFARGTIMQHDNIVIAESGLTPCAQVRAVDHEKERTRALILAERPDPISQPGRMTSGCDLPVPMEVHEMPPSSDAAFPTSPGGATDDTLKMPTPLPSGAPTPVEPAFSPDGAKPAPLPSSVTESPVSQPTAPPAAAEDPGLRTPPPAVDPFSERDAPAPLPPAVPGAVPPLPPSDANNGLPALPQVVPPPLPEAARP